jgi:hypothetical protein
MNQQPIHEIVAELRCCSQKRRMEVAMALAQIGTHEAVGELIRMADGCRRRQLCWYTLEDQLLAVQALGASNSHLGCQF